LRLAIPRPVAYLLLIINAEARTQRTPEDKVNAWLYHAARCREYLRSLRAPGELYVAADEVSDDEAIDTAAKIAQKNEISDSYVAARRSLDAEAILLAFDTTVATALAQWLFVPFLQPLLPPVAFGALVGGLWKTVGGPTIRKHAEVRHYRRLARGGPGRVTSAIWARQPSRAEDGE